MTFAEHDLKMMIIAKSWPAIRNALHRGPAPKARRLTVRKRELAPTGRGVVALQKLAYAAGNTKPIP